MVGRIVTSTWMPSLISAALIQVSAASGTLMVGGARSGALIVAGPRRLPAASAVTPLISSPVISGGANGRLKLPAPSTFTVIGLAVSPSITRRTWLFGSAVPVSSAPSALMLSSGADGATVSTVVLAGPLLLPAASWATAVTTVPLASGVVGVKLQSPLHCRRRSSRRSGCRHHR